ncbi:MAG: phosphohydrolase [Desulfuromonadaceae bacterium]|nr:phosphohydrolase [Desulfuromonadaceae bacterium]
MTPLSLLKSLFPPALHDRIILVGGTVRDMLLGRDSTDIDLVAAVSPEDLISLGFRLVESVSATTIYFKYLPEFGTVDVTRIDNTHDLEHDLHRRDFTINAVAMDLSGSCIDPLGGREDLSRGILRACSDKTFTGDPLRLFRAFRFEADGWQMSPETVALIRVNDWSSALSTLPPERFSLEMLKALRGKVAERFFEKMIEFQVGVELLPELFRMPHIPAGPLQHHPEGDLFTHSIQVLQRVAGQSNNPLARFCAFFHDIGKLTTDPAHYPKHHGHDRAGFGTAVELCTRLCLPLSHRKALAWVSCLHGKANIWDTLRSSTRLAIAEQAAMAGISEILPLVAAADKAGGLPMAGWREVTRVAGMNSRELGIDQVKLESLPVKNRSAYMLQKRIEMLKNGIHER